MEKTENLIKALNERFGKSYKLVVLTENDNEFCTEVEVAFIKKCSNLVSFVCDIKKFKDDESFCLTKLTPMFDSGFITYYEIDEVAKSVKWEKNNGSTDKK